VEHRSTVSHAFRTEGTEKKEAIMLGYRAIPIAVLGLTLMAPALARAQPNDDCTTPTPIGALPFVDLVNTAGATVGGGDPVPSCGANDNNVWYSFTAVGATSLDLRTQGSTYDTVISVYGGACGALVETGCNDDRLTGSASQVVVPLAPGESVLIAVSSSSGGGGGLVFTADVSTPAYTTPAVLLDAARSTDANPNGGTLGFLGPAVAPTRRKVVFAGRTAGLFQSVGGVVTTIAAGGDATPAGGTFAALDDPATSDAGPTAFHATMAGAAANDGIFRWDGAALTTVVAAGDGAPDGGTYRSFERHVAVNDAGSVAFLARTNVSPGLRLFVHTTAATTIVASEDDPTPCGGTFRRLGQTSLPAFDLSNAGTVAFYGEVSGGDDGIFYFDGAVLSAVACDGDATPLGGTFSRLGVQPSIAHVPAGSLRVLFQSDLNGGPSAQAVWVWDGTTTASVVKVGDVMIDGNTVDAFHERSTPSINDAGDIAVPMTATGIASVSFRPAGGNIKVVVAEGMACPFGGFFVNVPVELSLGAAGDIAFDAGCTLVSGVVVYQLGGVLVAETSRFSVTSIGMGFSFETPAISGASEVVARGTRVDVHETSCSPAAGCATPPLVLASPNALVGLGGQQIQEIFPDTLTAAGRNVAFLALTKGVQDRMAVVRSRAGVLSTVAAGGQALPGGVPGTFEDFPLFDDVTGAVARAAVGRELIVFLAHANSPVTDAMIVAHTPVGLVILAAEGQVSPTGGVFEAFGRPDVNGRRIVFNATTDIDSCIYAVVMPPGIPLQVVACAGDPAPPAIGGTLQLAGAPATQAGNQVFFVADVSGGVVDQCLFAAGAGGLSPVLCTDVAYPFGSYVTSLLPFAPSGGPQGSPNGGGPAFFVEADPMPWAGLLALWRGRLSLLAESEKAAPGAAGGTFSLEGAAPSVFRKAVVFAAGLTGGSAARGIFWGTLR
jgi:hypothetical protein